MCKHDELEWLPELGPHGRYIDKCMVGTIRNLRRQGIETLACCCGHGTYPQTIVIRCPEYGIPIEYYTQIRLTGHNGKPKIRNFYQTDKNGLYFIPEVIKYEKTSKR